MRKFNFSVSCFAALLLLIGCVLSGGCCDDKAEVITRDSLGFYTLNGNPDSLELKTDDGMISLSRGEVFVITVAYPEKNFTWCDSEEKFLVIYLCTKLV